MMLRDQNRMAVSRELFRLNYRRECVALDQPGKRLTFLFLENRKTFHRFVGAALEIGLPEKAVR